ncbi:MAG: hypothetical protein LUD81_04815 [Clostridiales bacterium]|nr:hypothetical protein [Clostridiales bacterium]
MKGFELDENGDVYIEKTKIQMVSKTELLRQKVITVLGTNKGEWFLNPDEGINFNNLLGKKKDDEIIRNEILDGLQQVDETFQLTSFECDFDRIKRKLVISFSAANSEGEAVETTVSY